MHPRARTAAALPCAVALAGCSAWRIRFPPHAHLALLEGAIAWIARLEGDGCDARP